MLFILNFHTKKSESDLFLNIRNLLNPRLKNGFGVLKITFEFVPVWYKFSAAICSQRLV